jgi:Tol biopolymer transport system component/DNA-binding winged helix-turn-helix (wHTH) protein
MSGQPVRFYEFGPFRVDVSSRVLRREGEALPLEPKVFDTLLALLENRTRVVSKEELMKAVWGPDTFVEEGSLARNISLLRKTIAEGLGDTQCIATFPKRGYQFVATVRAVATSRSEEGVEGQSEGTEKADGGHPQGAPLRTGLAELRRHPVAVVAGCVAVLALALGYWFVRPLPAPVVGGHRALTDDGWEKRGPLLTDGPRLYFMEKADGRWVLAVVPTTGGNLHALSLPSPEVVISDIAPRGTDLVGWEQAPGREAGRMMVWDVAHGDPEILLGLQGKSPSWSPDGAKIAFSDGIHSLFVAGRHGESPRKVASAEGKAGELRWSPDGRFLRYSQQDPKTEVTSLWEVPSAGGRPHLLLTGWEYATSAPVWTADGSYSLFMSGPAEGPGIWARRENCNPFRWRCQEPIRITAGLGEEFAPLPSRDGKKLFVIGGKYRRELARYDLKSRTFAPYLPGLQAADLDFSRDGKWIVYVRRPERTLWRRRTDGSDAAPLTAAGAEVYSPHWSPDGKQIAYMTISALKQYKAWVVPADGGPPKELVPGAGEEGIPTWSRDGSFLVFGDVLHDVHRSEMAIHVFDLRSHKLSTLPRSTGLWTPRWSPNGRYIAALVLGDEARGGISSCPAVLLYDLRTSTWTRLANATSIRNLAWSRDSEYVYFHTASPDLGLYRAHILSKNVERLASLSAFASMHDDWLGVAPDGSPLIIGDTRIDEVYALDVQWP